MGKDIRIGFIGAGGISWRHWEWIGATDEAEVVAVTEPNDDAYRRFCERNEGADKLPRYQDHKEMIEKENLTGAVILSPHSFHYDQITYCLDHELHVMTEKPMVCTIQDAKDVMAKADKMGKTLMIAYQRHYEPTFRYMREQIMEGKLGAIEFVQAIQSQNWLKLVQGTWRQKMDLSCGGQLNDSGSHLVDIVMWVTGLKVREVFAKSVNFTAEVDINTTLAMTFENDALGSMSVIGNAPGWYEDHSIVGSAGALYLRQGLGLIHQDGAGKPVEVKLPEYNENPGSNFVKCILGEAEPETPPLCGLRTIEVTEAAWESARLGQSVTVS